MSQIDAAENPLGGLRTRIDVAAYLATSVKQLNILLQARPEAQKYTRFTIPKRKGGSRVIMAPKTDPKILQFKLAGKLDSVYTPRHVVFGFVTGRSIVETPNDMSVVDT